MIQINAIILQWLYRGAVAVAFVVFAAATTSAEEPSAGTLFKQVEDHFSKLTTLSYSVKRVMVSSKMSSEERWIFRFRKPDFVRIDYQAPHERTIIMDGTTLWEYIPQLKKAAKTNLAAMAPDKKDKTIADVMGHVAVDGLRIGDYGEMEKRALPVKTVAWSGKDVYVIEGKDPRYMVYIDKETSALLRTEIYDRKGGLTMRTQASRLTEAGKGFWLPQEIRATYRSSSGFVQSTITLQDIRVDAALGDEIFRFDIPKGVEVILN